MNIDIFKALTILKALDKSFFFWQQLGRMGDRSLNFTQIAHGWNLQDANL